MKGHLGIGTAVRNLKMLDLSIRAMIGQLKKPQMSGWREANYRRCVIDVTYLGYYELSMRF